MRCPVCSAFAQRLGILTLAWLLDNAMTRNVCCLPNQGPGVLSVLFYGTSPGVLLESELISFDFFHRDLAWATLAVSLSKPLYLTLSSLKWRPFRGVWWVLWRALLAWHWASRPSITPLGLIVNHLSISLFVPKWRSIIFSHLSTSAFIPSVFVPNKRFARLPLIFSQVDSSA